ncbi:MAG: site-specific integrase [Chloroflexi bacterium]|nr:site-specific integrase [Chloroflexota bacterium]
MIAPSDRAPRTRASYADEVRLHLVPALGNIPLSKLNPQHVQAFVNQQRKQGYSRRSIQYRHAILRRALADAERWGLVSRNVARLVTNAKARPDPARVHGLTAEEVRRLLAVARQDRFYALLLVTATVGLRRGEVLGLRWQDLDLGRGTLRVEQTVQRVPRRGLVVTKLPKNSASRRTNELATQVVDVLRDHRRIQMRARLRAGSNWQDNDLVFPSLVGTPVEPRNLNRHLHALCKRAGLPPERFHNLRHTAASIAYAEGLDSKMVQDMLGHASYRTTADIYTHLEPGLRREAAQRIADAVIG